MYISRRFKMSRKNTTIKKALDKLHVNNNKCVGWNNIYNVNSSLGRKKFYFNVNDKKNCHKYIIS